MTWLWITVFVLACILPLAGYIYLVEVRDTIAPEPDPESEHDVEADLERTVVTS
jgi:hypothetical protein